MVKKILNVVFWVVIVGLAAVWLFEFFQVKSNNDPKLCLKKEIHQYDDGTIMECTGLGYKVYKYERTSMAQGIEFGPFFIKMRTE